VDDVLLELPVVDSVSTADCLRLCRDELSKVE